MEILINFLNSINVETFTIINAIISVMIMLFMMKAGKDSGLQAYIYLALTVANIQVMKGTNFFFTSEPVPLGTLTYGTISIALSILTEISGEDKAKKTISLGTFFTIGFTVFIIMTLGYKPLSPDNLSNELYFLYDNHLAMKKLFMPIPTILISSLLAYFFSERSLVFIQIIMREFIKSISIRTYISNSIAALIDLIIMNSLAWVLFNPNPITIKQLFISYILAAYPFRLLTALIAIPVIKIALFMSRKEEE